MHINEKAALTLKNNRVAIFLVAYNAEKFIAKVLKRIPPWIAEGVCEIYVIDDHSADQTVSIAQSLDWPTNFAPLKIYRTPHNQGYGGNQRLGYLYAIQSKFDIVVLLHADGQYAPEALPEILGPYEDGADAVFGSRFLNVRGAIKGNMPLYKWVGNRVLTKIQNFLLDSHMSEMHSGYRSYRTSALTQVPFEYNSLGFDFDADIIVQFLAMKFKIIEVPIPTFYGDEICHVNGMEYAWNCVKTALRFRLMRFEIFYDPKFDFKSFRSQTTQIKKAKTSLHNYLKNLEFIVGTKLLDINGVMSEVLVSNPTFRDVKLETHFVPLNQKMEKFLGEKYFDGVFALDILEHLDAPEDGADCLFNCLKVGGKVYASTGNIGFVLMRIMLLFGFFNYSRRGILDLSHRRLFTIYSFTRLLKTAGFQIDYVKGFGPPIRDIAPHSKILSVVDEMFFTLAQWWPSVFAFHFLIVATRTTSVDELLKQSFPETYSFPIDSLGISP